MAGDMKEARRIPLGRFSGCIALAAALLGGCEQWDLLVGSGPPARPLGAWVAGDMVGLTTETEPVEDPRLFDRERNEVSLFAAANETVSVQVVLDADERGAKGVQLKWGDLAGPKGAKIPADRVRAFRMLPIRVREYPAWYLRLVPEVPTAAGVYDPLVPLAAGGEEGLSIPANGRLAVWLDVAVPRGAEAGQYRTKLTVSSATHAEWSVDLRVEVYAFVLPDARAVPAVGGFDYRQLFGAFLQRDGAAFDPVYLDRSNPMVRQGLLLMRSLLRLAHAHRLDLFDTRIRPVMKRAPDGGVKLLWDDYDAIVMPYLDGTAFDDRLGCAAWPVPFSQDWPRPGYYGGTGGEAYARTVTDLLGQYRAHFAEKLGVGERVFLWPCRNRTGEAAYALHARLASLARGADANTPILCQLAPSPPERSGWTAPEGFEKLHDILAPPGEQFDPVAALTARRPEHPLVGTWMSAGTPPYLPSLGIIARPADVRALPWLAMKYRCSGLFLPDVLGWEGDPFGPVATANTRLFYPGTVAKLNQPLPSVRLKRLRRGLQDLAYLWILERRNRPGIARGLSNALARYGGLAAAGDHYLDPRLDGWEHDGAAWELARRILAEEVQAVVRPELAHRTQTLAHRLAWRQFNERTRRLVVERVRSRVEPAGEADAGAVPKLRMTVFVDLYNQYGRDLPVEARLAGLPANWRAVPPATSRFTIRAASRYALRLGAVGQGLAPTRGDARLPVPVRVESAGLEPRELVAAVPVLVAGWTRKPPKIDGKLDDWPPRQGNTAREFRLIGRRGRAGDGLARRQTQAFVLRDAENLYLAFRCEEPNPAGIVRRPNNIVHYEQLMACGEDLVEVLLDPGGQAAGPEDLYHLVVKPNGVVVSERGVRSEPPLGRVTSWAPQAAVAVGTQKGVWVVELAVPLSAFGRGAKQAFWRVNFTRYAPQGAESSSWSGVPRYFYDPRNLGTMFLAAPPPAGEAVE